MKTEENSRQNVYDLLQKTMNNQGLRQSILCPRVVFQLQNMIFYFLHKLT